MRKKSYSFSSLVFETAFCRKWANNGLCCRSGVFLFEVRVFALLFYIFISFLVIREQFLSDTWKKYCTH